MYTEMLQKKLTSGIHPQNGTKVDVVSVGGPKLNLPWFGNHLISFWYGIKDDNKTESHYRSARLVQAFKILEFKMMLRFNESCH